MADDRAPIYDSFVIRVWQETINGHLLRAEIDHVQSGAVFVRRDVPPGWILDTLRSALKARTPGSETTGGHNVVPDIPDG